MVCKVGKEGKVRYVYGKCVYVLCRGFGRYDRDPTNGREALGGPLGVESLLIGFCRVHCAVAGTTTDEAWAAGGLGLVILGQQAKRVRAGVRIEGGRIWRGEGREEEGIG